MWKRVLFNKALTGFFIFAVTFIFLSAGCKVSSGQESQNPVSTKIEAMVGENAVITLDANHTTGYSWQLAKPVDKDMLEFVESKYEPSETGLIGSGGKEVWTFKALQSGETKVSFKYTRPWETEATPAREATFVIIIK